MNETLMLLFFGLFMLAAFTLGFRFGYKRDNENKRKEPIILDPIKAVKTKRENKRERDERDRQLEIEKIMLENIDAYDGTGLGQQDLPRKE